MQSSSRAGKGLDRITRSGLGAEKSEDKKRGDLISELNMEDAYVRSPSEVLKHFGVSESRGLSSEKVKEQRQKFGPNCMHPALHPHSYKRK